MKLKFLEFGLDLENLRGEGIEIEDGNLCPKWGADITGEELEALGGGGVLTS